MPQFFEVTAPDASVAPALAAMRGTIYEGKITDTTRFQPGLELHADPALKIGGRVRSPSGRLLELEVTASGTGDWIALHVELTAPDLSEYAFLGFACRHSAPVEQMIRPCLRSGIDGGFVDCFFDKHLLAMPEPLNHVDALHIQTRRAIPETALWRELVLFLPKQDFHWHLHDLRVFVI